MNYDFWASRWSHHQTGWHLQRVHPKLMEYWPKLGMDEGATVLVPFCGKSLDLDWLAERHQRVIGVEVVEQPVRELMHERHPGFNTRTRDDFTVYEAETLEVWNGDFFRLDTNIFPAIDGIYDRGGIVSLPPEKREKYSEQICRFASDRAQILLIVYDYDQNEMDGPPFSVPPSEVEKLFGSHFTIQCLLNQSILEEVDQFRRKGLSSYMELNIYHLYKSF